MGCEHIGNIEALPGAEVVAVSDPSPRSLGWARTTLGLRADEVEYSADHRGLLTNPSVDAVVVASPNFTHIDVLRDSLSTDKHVLIEKPLCTTVADCLEVNALAKERTALTWVALEYRFMPTISVLLDQVQSGVCGEVKMVAIREHRFPFLRRSETGIVSRRKPVGPSSRSVATSLISCAILPIPAQRWCLHQADKM